MKHVNIYLKTSLKGVRAVNTYIAYLLEYETPKGAVTKNEFIYVGQITSNRCELYALYVALSKLKEKCDLTIFTDSEYVTGGMDFLEHWTANNWKNSKGKEIGNKELWQDINRLLKGNTYEFRLKENHAYGKWLTAELEKRRDNHGI